MVSHPIATTVCRPFLKWAGGKTQLLSQYKPYFPKKFQTYYEPFLGGGAVFFYLQSPRAFLSDINPELINVYCCVRDQVEALIQLLENHQNNHSQAYYYHIRSLQRSHPTHAPILTDLERAARLIYLNKTCFNGIYRENSKGEFNVPMGRYKNPKICQSDVLRAASIALQSATLEVRSFDAVLDQAHGSEDFVYFDPPYYPISATSNFTAYSHHSFTETDQVKLFEVFKTLAERKVKVLLSNSDCSFIRDLYKDFNIHSIQAARMLNSKIENRGKISEVLITSD